MVKPKALKRQAKELTNPVVESLQHAVLAIGKPRINQSVVFKKHRFAALDMAQEESLEFYE